MLAAAAFEGLAFLRDGLFEDCNQQMVKLLGQRRALLKTPFLDSVAPEHRPVVKGILAQRECGPYEFMALRRDGTTFAAEMQTRATVIAGTATQVVAVRAIGERKRVAESLQMFQFTVDQASDAVQWLNRDGGFDYVNEQACRSLGYSRDELMQMYLWDVDPSITKERWAAEWKHFQAAQQGGVVSAEGVHRRKDGTLFPVDVRTRHLWFGDRELHVAVARDISELKQAQQNLAQSEVRYRSLVQQSSDVIVLLSSEGIITYISPQSERITGYRPEDLVGQNPMAFVHEDDLVRLQTALNEVVQKTNPGIPTEFRFRHGQGHWVHLEALGTNLLEHAGIGGLLVTCRDVTERNSTQETLRAKTEELNQFFSVALDLLCIADSDGRFRHLNPQWENVLGFSLSELEGRHFLDLVHPEDRAATLAAVGQLAEQKSVLNFVNRYRCKDGSYRWIEWRSCPAGNLIYAAARDITDRKQAEETLERTRLLMEAILEQSPVPIVVASAPDLVLRFGNRAAAEFLGVMDEPSYAGLTLAEAQRRKTWQDLRSDGTPLDLLDLPLARAVRGETTRNLEWRVIRKDGTERWELASGTPIYSSTGEVVAGLVVFPDITDRKQAEEKFRRLAAEHRTVLNTVNIGLALIRDRSLEWVNPAFAAMLGYEAQELVGTDGSAFYVNLADYQRVGEEGYAQLAATGIYGFEAPIRRKDGIQLWCDITGQAVNPENLGDGTIWAVRDITARKQMEADLERERLFTNAVLDSVPGLLYLYDDQGHLIRWNKQHETMTGYSAAELAQMQLLDWYRDEPEEAARITAAVQRIPVEGHAQEEALLVTKHGQRIPFFFTAVGLRIDERDYFVGIGIDITERRHAEAALRENEERLRLALEGANQGLFDLNLQTGAAVVSPEYVRMLGYEPGEAAIDAAWWRDQVHPDDMEMATRTLAACVQGQRVDYRMEYRLKTKVHEWKWILSLGRVVGNDDQGRPLRMLGTHTDITERKRVEEHIRRLSKEQQVILDTVSVGISLFVDRKFQWSNPAAAAQHGYAVSELQGMDAARVYATPEEYERVGREAYPLMAAGAVYTTEALMKHRDGTCYWAQLSGRAVNPQDLSEGSIWIIQDITERKRAEEALKASERNYREMFDASNDGIFVHDGKTGAILDVNHTVAEMYGYTREEAARLEVSDFSSGTPPYSQHEAASWVRKAATEGPQLFEWRAKRKNGELFWVEVNLKAAVIGGQDRILAVVRDITERKLADEALRENEQRFRAIFNCTYQFTGLMTPEGILTEANQAALDFAGVKLEEVINQPFWETHWWRGDESRMRQLREAICRAAGGEFVRYEVTLNGAGETTAIVDFSLKPVFDPAGRVILLIPEGRDVTERKRAEDALRRSEARLEAAQAQAHIGNWLLNPVTGEGYWSKEMFHLCGCDPVLGLPTVAEFLEMVVPEDRGRLQAAHQRVLETGEPYHGEFTCCLRDGSSRYFSTFIEVAKDEASGLPCLVGTLQDITERTRAEAVAKESQERLALALEGANLGSWDSDIRTGGVHVNERYAHMLGYEPEEIESHLRNWESLVHPDDLPGMRENLRAHLEGRTPFYETELRMRHKAGHWVWVLDRGKVIERDATGRPLRAAGTHLDITERKTAEERLFTSRQMLRTVLDTIPTRVFWKDRTSVYVGCNRAFAQDHGVSEPDALVGKTDFDTASAVFAERYRTDDQEVMTTGQGKLSFEEPQVRPDGCECWLLTNKVPLHDLHGQVVGVLGTYEDITDRKRTEAALRESEERFRQLFENSRAVMLLMDPESGAIVEANPAAARFYGYPRATLCQKAIEDINTLPASQVKRARETVDAGLAEDFEFPHRLASGEVRTVEVRSSPVGVGGRRLLFSIIQDITERKQAEEALAQERELLSTVINLLPDGVYVKDRDSRFMLANQTLAERFGKQRPAELLGFSDQDFFPQETASVFRGDEEQVFTGKLILEKEENVLFPNGQERVILTTKVPLRNRRGEIVGVVGAGRDITERKRAEEALRESMRRLQTVVTGAPIVLYSFDRHGVFTLSEGKGLTGLGLKPGQIVGKTVFEVYGGLPEQTAALRRALAGETFTVELSFPAGGIFEASHVALRDEAGEYDGTIGVLVDISERVRAEAAVRESEEKFRALVETTNDFIWEVDAEGHYTYASPQVNQLLGYTPEEILGKAPFDLMPPDEATRVRAVVDKLLEVQQPLSNLENVNRHKDGRLVVVETNGTPILDAAGRLRGYRGIDRDITERKLAEAALRESQARFEAAQSIAKIGSWESDFTGENRSWSRELFRLLGFDEAEGVPSVAAILEILHPEDLPVLQCAPRRVAETGVEAQFETRSNPARGPVHHFINIIRLVRRADGTPLRLAGTMQDITERKQAEAALQRSEALLRATLESIEDGLLVVSATGHVSHYNARFLEIWTIPAELADSVDDPALLAHVAPQLVDPEQFTAGVQQIYNSDSRSHDTLHFKDGRVVERLSAPVQSSGELRERMWLFRDVTARVSAEIALRDREARLASIFRAAPVGIGVLANRVVREVNETTCQITGYSREELIGQSSRLVYPTDEEFATVGALYPRLEAQGILTTETRWRRKDGALVHVMLNIAPIDPQNPAQGVTFVVLDITERKRAQEALEKRIVALTRPLDAPEGVVFEDLFNPEDIQRLQDLFAKACGVASIITRPDGTPLTNPSNFCALCNDIIRKTERGRQNCYCSDAILGRHNPSGPVIQPCLSGGLWDAGASITVGGRHVANWLIGQVRNETQSEERMMEYAREIGADENAFRNAFRQVPMMSREQFEQVAQALFALASQLSATAYQNIQQARFIAERKQAETALLESEDRFRQVVEASPVPIGIATADGQVEYLNPKFTQLFGYTVEDMPRLEDWYRLAYPAPEYQQRIRQEWEEVLRQAATEKRLTASIEVEAVCKDGTVRTIEILGAPAGNRVVTMFSDLTERRQAQERIRRLANEQRIILDTITLGISFVRGRRIQWANPAHSRMFGYQASELPEMESAWFYSHAEDHERVGREAYARFASGTAYTTEVQLKRKDGTPFWCRMTGQAVNPQYPDEGSIWVCDDITERKQAEEALRLSEQKFRSFVETTMEWIWIIDTEGKHTFSNPAAETILGYAPEELLGRAALDLVHPEDQDSVAQLLQDEAVLRTGWSGVVLRWRHKDGSYRFLESSAVPVFDAQGCCVGFQGTDRDITERKRAEEALRFNAERVQTLLKLNQMTDASLQEITDYALEESVRLTGSQIGYLAFLNEEETVLTMHSWSKQAMAECAIQDKPIHFVVKETGLWGEPVRQRRAVITNDYTALNPRKQGLPVGHGVVHRHLSVPVFVGQHIVLVAGLGNKEAEYDENDVRQLTLLMEGMWRLVERKRAEEALARERELLRTVINLLPDSVYVKDRDSRFLLANRTLAARMGKSRPEEVLGLSDCDFLSAQTATANRAIEERVLAGEALYEHESDARFPTGTTLTILTTKIPLRDQQGEIVGLVGVGRDITERKRAEAAVQESEQKFRTLFEHMAEGVALHEVLYNDQGKAVDYRLLDANPAYGKHTGLVAAQVRGKRASELYGTGSPPYLTEWAEVARTGKPSVVETFFAPMGKHFHVSAVSPKRGFFATVFEDITERKRTEEELRRKNEELGRFTYTVSHDLKSPLITIKGFAGALLEDVAAGRYDRVQEDLKRIAGATDKMAELLNDLLELSRIGRIMNPPSEVDLDKLVREVVELLAGPASQGQVEIMVQPGLPVIVGDRQRLMEVFQNLIENAIRFMGDQPQPRVEVGQRQDGAERVFFVRDNGVGIEPSYHETVFGLFNKLDAKTAGTGIGLALVRRIVEVHGGRIWVESEGRARGATFCFTLPFPTPQRKESQP